MAFQLEKQYAKYIFSMQLSRQSDLALRVLMYAAERPAAAATIGEIADFHRVSKNHLMVVVHRLGRAGYLDTVRGRSGGLRLSRPPAQIGVGEVVRYAESGFALVECLGPENTCRINGQCRLKGILQDALDAFLRTLDRYTLADLVGSSGVPIVHIRKN